MAQPPRQHPDRVLLKVQSPATKAERELIYVNILLKRYQEEHRHGRIVITFQEGSMTHVVEEQAHKIPNPDNGSG